MPKNNILMIAAAGSGKTTFLVKEALKKKDETFLITTFTISNKNEIIRKIIEENKSIPPNITVQTWVSFLLQHGAKPYQGYLFQEKITGHLLVKTQSALKKILNGSPIYYKEDGEFRQHYFTSTNKIFSDKLSKFVVKCNEKSGGEVINRLQRIYSNIFIDEVQDLAGSDLDILKLLFASNSNILLVGDPRQVTYLTHIEKLHSAYANGKIEKFFQDKCKDLSYYIDKTTLKKSHRNNSEICSFSSKLYPNEEESLPCNCTICRSCHKEHEGIYLVKEIDVGKYIELYKPVILRYKESSDYEWNFGESKGLSFDRVLIYPTKEFKKYLIDGKLTKTISKTNKRTGVVKQEITDAFDIAKFYVAITRARYSVGIVYNYKNEIFIEEVNKFEFNKSKVL